MEKRDVQTLSFRMTLNPGMKAEYQKRHNDIWPELVDLLKAAGIYDYSIFFDDTTNALFAVFKCAKSFDGDSLAEEPTMRRWWDYMADIMEVQKNNAPVAIPLEPVFYLP